MTPILCIAGFGDDASMFAPLVAHAADLELRFHPLNLPGFGAPPLPGKVTTLDTLAAWLADQAAALGATTVLAHSVASIIACIAANQMRSPLTSVLSLEGNLTPEDAYFSGTAAQYDSAEAFHPAFLAKLDEMIAGDPILVRYRRKVAEADAQALWTLGCDAARLSRHNSPGALLQATRRAAYLFNPDNLPETSRAWLATHALARFELPGASHWASVDQPRLLAKTIARVLADT